MSRIFITFTSLAVLLAIAGFSQAADISLDPKQIHALGIQTARPLVSSQASGVSLPAQVVIPNKDIHIISPSVNGMIEQVLVNAGDHVKAGEPLLVIRSAELVSLQRDYLQALLQAQLATNQKNRDDQLLREGIIATSRQQQSTNQAAIQRAAVQERQQILRLAGMAPADIRTLARSHRLDNQLMVRAPVNATVLETSAKPGERRDMNTPLMKLAATNNLWLEIQLPVSQAGSLPPGTRLVDDTGQWQAEVTAVVQAANPNNQTMTVRARILKPAANPIPGSYVNVHPLTQAGGWLVAASAVVNQNGQTLVFVRSANGFRTVPVTVMETNDQQTRVTGKLTATDEIAVRGTIAIKAVLTGSSDKGE